jgi:hypothetical protein
MIPIPDNVLFLGFLFALLFCIFNCLLSVFIFIWSVLLIRHEYKHILRLTNIRSSSTEPFDFKKKIVFDGKKLSLVNFGKTKESKL